MRYNKNPDVSGKVVGSNSINNIDRDRVRDIGGLLAFSDLVLVGDENRETFELTQLGVAGNDLAGETKVKRGETYVFFLRENEEAAWAGSYTSVAFEDGIFQVLENGKVLSLTDNLHLAIYDDRSMDLLVRDLETAVKQGVK